MVDCGSGPQSASLGEKKTIANQTVQLNAKPSNHPFPTPRSGFVQVAGANRRWRIQFRCRGSRHESAVAQLDVGPQPSVTTNNTQQIHPMNNDTSKATQSPAEAESKATAPCPRGGEHDYWFVSEMVGDFPQAAGYKECRKCGKRTPCDE